MGQVAITLNDRIYRLVCDDGEEDRLVELAGYVKGKVADLTANVGNAGHDRILLMVALMIADELWDTRAELEKKIRPAAAEAEDSGDPEPVRRLKKLAERMSVPAVADLSGATLGEARPSSKSRRRDSA